MSKDRVWKIISLLCLLALGILAGAIYGYHRERTETIAYSGERVVVIDPGHGGEDGGAVAADGTVESGLNLDIAKRLDTLLRFCGHNTLLLRREDVSLHDGDAKTILEKKVSDLHNRVETINALADPVVISIHQNFFLSSKYHGAHVFYANGPLGQPWAEVTQKNLREILDPGNHRAAAPISQEVYLMNHIQCPAILVECGFLSNIEEREKLKSAEYQRALAVVIAGSYLQYTDRGGEGDGTQGEESFLLHAVRK